MARGTRPRKNRIEVWCSNDEFSQIKTNAQNTKLSLSEFLRILGKGYQPKGVFDIEAIRELTRLHADQGRLGGLLKLWLSENKGVGASVRSVRSVLQQIEDLQSIIANLILKEARRL